MINTNGGIGNTTIINNFINVGGSRGPGGPGGLGGLLGQGNIAKALLSSLTELAGNLLMRDMMQQIGQQLGQQRPMFPQAPTCNFPSPAQSCHPQGSLQVDKDKGTIKTPGGYEIEQVGKFDWKIKTPEGKETLIWGDPHVKESDGGTWDFKRDSVFKLPDGTQIKVNTVPYGNGMTVTGSLEVVNGNESVNVTGIDKGKGKVGDVQYDGFMRSAGFQGLDTFTMSGDGDDWAIGGREIVGSEKGGEIHKLGNQIAPMVDRTNQFGGPRNWAQGMFGSIMNNMMERMMGNMLNNMVGRMMQSFNPYGNMFGGGNDLMGGIGRAFSAVGDMLQQMQQLQQLAQLAQFANMARPVAG